MKKRLLVIGIVVIAAVLYSCGGSAKGSQSDQQVAELQRQVAELQQQVQQNSNTQIQQTVAQTQVAQQAVPQTQVAQQPMQTQQFGVNQNASVTLDQAKQIATSNAGLDVNAVTYIKTMQDYDNGYLKWEIDFVSGNTKYDYDISAYDGTILKAEREAVAYQGNVVPQTNLGVQVPQQNAVGQGVGQATGQGIDVESAKSIAVSHAGFTTAGVTFVKQKYDFDDGIAKWEIEFVVNTNKYEYEVNAANGTIVKYKVESIYSD